MSASLPTEPQEMSQVSDGYHTFEELYDHRHALFAVVLAVYDRWGFKTRCDSQGHSTPGWFIAGLDTPFGQLTYHMPDHLWDHLHGLRVVERNADYDGHTSDHVLLRLWALAHHGPATLGETDLRME